MTVLAAPHATFRDLRRLLLKLWLDCGCGHLSSYSRLAEPAAGPWPRRAKVRGTGWAPWQRLSRWDWPVLLAQRRLKFGNACLLTVHD